MRRQPLRDRLRSAVARGDWPLWADFEIDKVGIPQLLVQEIDARLQQRRCCVLEGAEGRGKTSLARYIGYRAARDGKAVYHVDAADPDGDTSEQIANFIALADHSAPLYVVENVSELESEDDLLRLGAAARASVLSQFLFLFRSAGQPPTVDYVVPLVDSLGLEAVDVKVSVKPAPDLIQSIVDKHINSHARKNLTVPSASNIEEIAKRCRQNLRVLSAYLDAWDGGSLLDVDEGRMLRNFFERRFAEIEAVYHLPLVGISTVAQFGVAAPGRVFGLNQAQELARQGWLTQRYYGLEEYFSPAHATDAAITVRAWALVRGGSVESLTLDGLRRFLTASPAFSGVGLLFTRILNRKKLLHALAAEDAVQRALLEDFRLQLDEAPLSFAKKRIEATEGTALEHVMAKATLKRGSAWFLARVRDADEVEASWALRYFGTLDPGLRRKVNASLSSNDWVAIWLRLPLPKLIRFIWRYADESDVHEHTEQARTALRQLSEDADLPSRIQALSLELVGKLLLVTRKLDESAYLRIGRCVADSLKLSGSSETVRLTLILKELAAGSDKTIPAKLVDMVLREVPFAAFEREVSGRGIAFTLVTATYAMREGLLQATPRDLLVSTASSNVILFEQWDAQALQAFLWAGAQIDAPVVRQWARRLGEKGFASAASRTDRPMEVFYLIWNLWQVDEGLCITVAGGLWGALADQGAQGGVEVQTLPLLGLCAWIVPEGLGQMKLPRPRVAAKELLQQEHVAATLFAWRAYVALDAQQAQEFGSLVKLQADAFRDKIESLPMLRGKDVLLSFLRELETPQR